MNTGSSLALRATAQDADWSTAHIPDQQGKTFVVTGGNAGIGFATAAALAAKRATVVIGCRNADKARDAIAAMRSQYSTADIIALPLDLSSLASVREFAASLAARTAKLDVLINNAGVMMTPQARTQDGFEVQFATNVLGHFALTGLVMPLLAQAPAARVVTLSSLGHWFGRLELDNLNGERRYDALQAYAQSKLANLVLAFELQRRLARAGSKVASIAVHPGVTHSDLGRYAKWVGVALRVYGQSVQQGALPSLMAATDPSVAGGDFIGPAGFLTFKGAPRRQRSRRFARDTTLGAALWERVQQMTAVRYL